MARKNIAVLDFGSSRVSVMIGDRGINNTFDIRGYAEINYAGYLEGEFLEPENLIKDVQQVLALAENNARCKITHLYIGVPAEFSFVKVKKVELDFEGRHKINDRDIADLFDSADVQEAGHTIINRAPIYYVLDDGYKIIKPKGKITESISGLISFVMCQNSFLEKVKSIFSALHISHIEFFSEQLCEALYLVEPEQRDNCAILVDTGFLSSSVSVIMGDGLLNLHSFSLGTGHIIADFCDTFNITAHQAKEILKDISLLDRKEEIFEIQNGSSNIQISSLQLYEIVEARVQEIANMIKKCLSLNENIPKYLPILLTGGGVCQIEGATNIISEITDKDVQIVAINDPRLNEPKLAPILSLLDLALKQNKQSLGLFFIRLFKKN